MQTLFPSHYSIRHATRQDYVAFYTEEIRFRQSMRYPPAVGLINAVVRSPTMDGAMTDASQIVRALRRTARRIECWGRPPPLSAA